MSTPGSISELLIGAAGAGGGYEISRSLRFNSSDSAYLSRTPASAGNRKTWTWAGWVKLAKLGTRYAFFQSSDTGFANYFGFEILAANNIWTNFNGSSVTTANILRDPSAWYHLVISCDTTQATSSDRAKIYINGIAATIGSATYPAQNFDTAINATEQHNIGAWLPSAGVAYSDFYLADIHFIDGQALDPTSFGEFDDNGIWQPKAYTGTYGTNGFHLPFSDNSTAAALGTDTSGNGNTWTVNNINASSYAGVTTTVPEGVTGDWVGILGVVPSDTSGAVAVFPDGGGTSSTIGTFFWSGLTVGDKITWYGTSSNQNRSVVGDITETSVDVPGASLGSFALTVSATSGSAKVDFNGTANCYGIVPAFVGSGIDSLVDIPTNGAQTDTGSGGEVRGNYCTWNPLANFLTLANGNLNASQASVAHHTVYGTIGVSSGKWYWEITKNDGNSAANTSLGLAVAVTSFVEDGAAYISTTGTNTGYLSGSLQLYDGSDGFERAITVPGGLHAAGTWMFAFDFDNGKGWLGKDGTWFSDTGAGNEGDPATGANPCFDAFVSGATYVPLLGMYAATNVDANFGQRPFTYTAPSGFKALNTANLPAPTIEDPSTVMDVALYTGNGSSQTISGLNMSPDLVWIKGRSSALQTHVLVDTVRGVSRMLQSNATAVELNDPGYYVSAFNSDGFDVTDNTNGSYNVNGSVGGTFSGAAQYAAWTWDAGSSTVTNTAGSISSQVRANASAGFSIVTYTGTGANATVGHGLGVAPQMIIVKSRGSVTNWGVGHTSIGWANALRLNTTDASSAQATFWNSTAPTSTVFSIGTGPSTNNNGDSIVAYCFAPVAGYSAFGSYTGNGSTDGSFVYTGFRPRWVMVKRTNDIGNWTINDAARNTYNVTQNRLWANLSDAESTSANYYIDFLSNGFKVRTSAADTNASASTYIYAAFAESPFQYARAR